MNTAGRQGWRCWGRGLGRGKGWGRGRGWGRGWQQKQQGNEGGPPYQHQHQWQWGQRFSTTADEPTGNRRGPRCPWGRGFCQAQEPEAGQPQEKGAQMEKNEK